MPIKHGSKINKTEISFIEKKYNLKFPADYINFLENFNGYYIASPDFCDIEFDKVDNGYISFEVLLGYNVNNKNFEICTINDELLDEISSIPQSFAIGLDPGDNVYVLIVSGPISGVYYWDRTGLHMDDENIRCDIIDDDSNHLYLIANNFSQFFSIITSKVKNNNIPISKQTI